MREYRIEIYNSNKDEWYLLPCDLYTGMLIDHTYENKEEAIRDYYNYVDHGSCKVRLVNSITGEIIRS